MSIIRIVLGILVIQIVTVSCESKQKNLDSARSKFENGEYDDAIKLLDIAKKSSNYELLAEANKLEESIRDTLFAISEREMRTNRNDTIFLQFVFKMNENEVESHVKKLIIEGKLKPPITYTFELGWGDIKQELSLTGYELDFFINNYKCTGLVKCSYLLNELDNLEITLFNYPESKEIDSVLLDLTQMFNEKYGDYQSSSPYYSDKDSKYIKCFWRESNKSICLGQIGGFIIISYKDLVAKSDRAILSDELNKVQHDLNTEKSKTLQDEL